ncbi:MerR family transcriptional regulator [Thaumasiovibrio subtropicus]|uniref:MerR family transcriptional regulator n=1 Tax=Thaumasiovibrio subtropicus TaxID=1891207 RepID=UPI000B35D0C6|nr:MerR family transcriptional regulator [Thaumasiovibrio subtropicus]
MAYRISELAEQVGLSRTALLYYEKQGLIKGRRRDNGYREYNDNDIQRVRLIQQLQAGGLSLKECKACLTAKIDRRLLQQRLHLLDEEIAQKQQSRQFLAGLLGEHDLKAWHTETDKLAPQAHLEWLKHQGFNEKEALRLKWLSKDMNEHDQYMADFMHVFNGLDRWGPGTDEDTLHALRALPCPPIKLLEIGCGNGTSTKLIAAESNVAITAVDNEQGALDRLQAALVGQPFANQITPVCASMTDLPFEDGTFDTLWAESCAYIMGFNQALTSWRRLLNEGGFMVISDLIWRTDTPAQEAIEFWKGEYPDITTVATRQSQIAAAGYELVSDHPLSDAAWQAYYEPLAERVDALRDSLTNSAALADIEREIAIYRHYLSDFGYHFFIVQKRD